MTTEFTAGWARTSLGSICLPVRKTDPRSSPDLEFEYIDIGGISPGSGRIQATKSLRGAEAPSRARQVVHAGDIVLSTVRTYQRKTAIVPAQLHGAVASTGFSVLRPVPGVDSRFLLYQLLSHEFVSQLNPQQTGTSYPAVRDRDVRAMGILIAPTAEQERIVAAIEEHFSRLDALEFTLQKDLQQLETLTSTTLVEAFHSNRNVPPHWNWTTIGDVAEIRGGIQKQPKRRPNENPAPFLRVANVLRGELLLDEVHQIELFDGELEKYRLRAGDLLVVEGNGSPQQIGRAACWEDEIAGCVHQNHLIRVRPGPRLASRYLALYWNAPHTASTLRDVASSTSGLYTLSTQKVKSIPIPLAPLPEQWSIVEEVDQQLGICGRLEQSIRRALDRLQLVRLAVLAAAFSGRLVPQDPTDEPASVLLESIAASRRTTPMRQGVSA